MNIDELIVNLTSISNIKFVHELNKWIIDWKSSSKDVNGLKDMVEKFYGNSWIDDQDVFQKLYELWTNFKLEAIDGIKGMTMNERLYYFSLVEIFENENEAGKERIYSKLLASK